MCIIGTDRLLDRRIIRHRISIMPNTTKISIRSRKRTTMLATAKLRRKTCYHSFHLAIGSEAHCHHNRT